MNNGGLICKWAEETDIGGKHIAECAMLYHEVVQVKVYYAINQVTLKKVITK